MLYLSLKSENSQPLYIQLYQQIREEIQSGNIKANEKVPSKRELANQLHISVNTVNTAYNQLVAEGFLRVKPQSGYYVCPIETLTVNSAVGTVRPSDFIPTAQAVTAPSNDILVDFSINAVDRDEFPFSAWRKAMHHCFNEYDPSLLASAPPQGDMDLRKNIASYLYRSRGVVCTPEQIVIGAGNDDLLQILSYLLGADCTIAMENPAYHKARLLFQRMQHRVLSVPLDSQGIQIHPLDNLDHVAVYIAPSHQFPLGLSMPISRRIQLLNWCAQKESRYIIEDDYDSEFRYQNRPIPALHGMDQGKHVIYLGTFSKSIAPSLRISYMVLPYNLLKKYQSAGLFQSSVSRFEQAVVCEFIKSGQFERHLNKMRKLYRSRCEKLINELTSLGDSLQICSESAGFYLVVQLQNGLTEADMQARAAAKGVIVYPISPYFHGEVPEEHRNKVLLGFASLSDDKIEKGVALLREAWLL